MDQTPQQQQTTQGAAASNHVQNAGTAVQNNMPSSINLQQQHRPSGSIQGSLSDIPQNSPVPAVNSNNPNQIQNQQLNHLQMPQQLQPQHQQFNQQYPAVQNTQTMQQHPNVVTQAPQQNITAPSSGQQSQSNSLNPSPVSQPAVISHPPGQQQHVLQPILNYQQPQQALQQGLYTQQPVAMIQTPIMYANAALVPPGQTVNAPSLNVAPNSEPAVAPPPGSPTEVVKRGRFRITKGGKSINNLADYASPNEVPRKELVDAVPGSEHGSIAAESTTTAQTDASITKKKGRFVVKTAKGDVQPDKIANQNAVVTKATNQNAIANEMDANKTPVDTEDDKAKPVDGPSEVSTANDESSTNKPVDPNNVKKKGRFVIKKGGNTARSSTPPPSQHHETASLDGSVSKHSIPTIVSAITSGFQDASMHAPTPVNPNIIASPQYQTQQQVFTQPILSQVSANVPVPIANVQPVGAYDINGNFVLVSAPIFAPQNMNIQQPPSQPITVQPPPPAVQITNTASQPQQPTPHQAPATTPDAKQKKPASLPKVPRPSEGIATSRPSIGGRIFGTSGVGKVLHHLESVRLEVLEADKSLASLQSENKILVSCLALIICVFRS